MKGSACALFLVLRSWFLVELKRGSFAGHWLCALGESALPLDAAAVEVEREKFKLKFGS